MRWKRNMAVMGMSGALLATGACQQVPETKAVAVEQPSGPQAPDFEIDATWPKVLPNNWIVGNVIGVAVDASDHIWIVHRPRSLSQWDIGGALRASTPDKNGKITGNDPARALVSVCCVPAPPVLEFDQEGNLLRHWGGPSDQYEWPTSEHGIHIDHKGNVWLGSSGSGSGPNPEGGTLDRRTWDAHILKFTQDGKFLMQIGKRGKSKGSNDLENFGRPTNMKVDPETNELFVSDGYGNHRVAVFDAETGKYKRHWGGYGKPPNDDDPEVAGETPGNTRYDPNKPPVQILRTVHSITLSNDGLVYVADRPNDRIQVFKKDGTFVKEGLFFKNTLRSGAVWDVALSRDPEQKYIFVPDGENHRLYVIQRDNLQLLRVVGSGGRRAGQLISPHSLAVDSKGNLYVGEALDGKRIHRFLSKGMAPTQPVTTQ